MNKKKVFIVIPTLGTGGGEKLVLDIAKNLDKTLFDISIVSLFASQNTIYEKDAKDENINVIYLNKKMGFDFKMIFKIIKLFKNQKPDIVHTHLNSVPYVLTASILVNVKSRVHTVHNMAERESVGVSRFIMKLAYKFFKFKPIAICNEVKSSIVNIYGIEPQNIPCIYNGIDTKRFTNNQNKVEDNYIRLITTGRLQSQKNHKLLIEAFATAKKDIGNIKLTILGDGELRKNLEELISMYNLGDEIILKGVVKDVAKELNKSDIYIMSSNFEGLPLSILEAMSCGLPIITTKAGGVIDIVNNGENGITVDIGDKDGLAKSIIELSTSRKLREVLGRNSYKLSKKYDIENTVLKYQDIYMEDLV